MNQDIRPKKKRRKPYITLNCKECGIEFDIPPNVYKARLKNSKNSFCSKSCSQVYRRGKPNNINYTEDLLLKMKKAQQNKQYSEESKQRMRENGKNSKTLFKKGHNIHQLYPELKNKILTTQKKESHWNWRGGITKEILALRGTQNYIDWRNTVFKRDNYTCQECGKNKCYLNAHHIVHFAKIYYENKKELFWDTSNGVTLCQECHYKKHTGVRKEIYAKTN